ncbi:putative aryl-alcohol dehydrogenase [Wickerhamomyces ciferrii]|uniref:Aryl-alcohol dehydrogenase n=1 Tax=Wickerhamomyces ciferrii (strain ATCC 14091 / BCRC 22168 / CBS 111 / JCM 3599 / NBRC 0793 / NRRL Y-1031 F-60-10) TaxID=1206466 RepID=K0KN90_WICCF|nr:putative aryl-alcohol dehydrogenase [Wickerhamomyces ciferrii]CCH43662.1 putative aryl-alcohol dehydrogenase [Wickerhamomyces ciferrii]
MSEEKIIEWTRLGKSGLKISKIIIGFMSYGSKKWADWVEDDEEKIFAILKRAYDLGLRTYDTADVYSNGYSEIILGKFLKKYNIKRDKVVILTKVFGPVDEDLDLKHGTRGPNVKDVDLINSKGLSRKHVIDGAENSVKRLGTYIDVLQIHRLDKETEPEEIVKALNDVVDSGLTRYIGASSMRATEFAELQFTAIKNGWHKFIVVQDYYNLLYREEERETIPFAKKQGVGIIPWSPNARGVLTRPFSETSDRHKSDPQFKNLGLDTLTDEDKEIINRVEEIAKKHNVSLAVVSTAWVLSKGANPIVGLNSIERVEEAVEASIFKLSEEETKYLEEPYRPKKVIGFPQ